MCVCVCVCVCVCAVVVVVVVCLFVCFFLFDTDKQETKKHTNTKLAAFRDSEGEIISDHFSVPRIRKPTSEQLEKPANNTYKNQTAKISEIVVL